MKKTLLALGVAAACMGAQAQSSVTLAGTVDSYFGGIRMAGDPGRKMVVNSGGMTTSWFGFKGSEDLGGGLKTNFALTGFFQADTGTPGRFTGDPFFSRDASVGLSGGFGSVTIGRGLAPNFLPTVIFNPFGDSFTFSPLVLHANVPLFNGTGWSATTPADTGWANEIIYSTPNFNGLSANLHYQMGEQSSDTGNSGKKNVGVNALYFGGPLALTAFYERAQMSNPLPAVTGDTKTDWMVGGSYDFKMAKAFLTYGQAESDTTNVDWKTTSVGLSVPVGAGSVLAGWAHTKVSTGATRNTGTVGYDYTLSKRTDVYAMLMHDAITSFSSGTSYGVGIRHRF